MLETCRTEIAELHAFFQAWFRAELPETDAAFARFGEALAPGFEIVTPSGKRLARDEILTGVRSARGSSDKRIWTRDERVREIADGLYLATYEEWQADGADERGRISTAVLRERSDAPGGVEWVHVHETWLAD